MSSSEDSVSQWFADHMEQTAMAGSQAAPLIPDVADALVNTLLGDGKILACANGNANTIAQYFCTALLEDWARTGPGCRQ